ncbi:hypothetical protein XELAEV_18036673mg [Xenopus laevis]|uniref:Uncharacterized protein n=1 Tax=Xenopus laevis TaxID=8355 RepID=A0A974CAM4_XENLA|nr:hypothetical protein XELAEV_18036673mg [Xenopus laevis]
MTILPKILYMLSHSPVAIPSSFFQSLDKLMGPFIWGEGRPRLRLGILKRSAALPDFQLYFLATHIAQIKPWISTDPRCFSTALLEVFGEAEMPILQRMLKTRKGRNTNSEHPLILLGIFECEHKLCLSQAKYPDTSIWGKRSLRDFQSKESTGPWSNKGIKVINHILTDHKLKPGVWNPRIFLATV